jgi:hypothetical protein
MSITIYNGGEKKMTDYEKFVKKKAEETQFSEDEIRAKLEKAKEQVENKYNDKSDEFKEGSVIKAVSSFLNNASSLENKTIKVIRVTGEVDTIAGMRNRAIEEFEKNPQKAIDKGLTNRNGEPVWPSGRNEGEVMPDHIWKKFIYGMDEDNQLLQIGVRKDLWDIIDDIEGMKEVTLGLANHNKRDDGKLHYWNLSRYSNPREIKDIEPEDLVDAFKSSDIYVDINEVREEIPEEGNVPVITKGFADSVFDDPPEDQSKRVTIRPADREESITVWVDPEEEIPFAQNSMVWLVASLRFGNRYREDMEQDPIASSSLYGMVPDPGGTITEEEEDIML